MKAVKIYQAGGPEQLIYQDVPTPDETFAKFPKIP